MKSSLIKRGWICDCEEENIKAGIVPFCPKCSKQHHPCGKSGAVAVICGVPVGNIRYHLRKGRSYEQILNHYHMKKFFNVPVERKIRFIYLNESDL